MPGLCVPSMVVGPEMMPEPPNVLVGPTVSALVTVVFVMRVKVSATVNGWVLALQSPARVSLPEPPNVKPVALPPPEMLKVPPKVVLLLTFTTIWPDVPVPRKKARAPVNSVSLPLIVAGAPVRPPMLRGLGMALAPVRVVVAFKIPKLNRKLAAEAPREFL